MKSNIDVSIVIVSMNNYTQLKDCLDSIYSYTQIKYEVIVVAYLFSNENLKKLKNSYKWITIVESNEIRGFSANNNLGLKEASGRYCFVLNDDTYFKTNVVDRLFETIQNLTDAVIVSPKIILPNGLTQYSGIPPIGWIDWIMILFKLKKERKERVPKYIKEVGIFQTYNILGAAFLIETEIFKNVGFFDEAYFFGPEDKALSTLLNRKGYKCYVDANIEITHIGGATGGATSKTVEATRPAERIGSILFYSDGSKFKKFILSLFVFFNSILLSIYWRIKRMKGEQSARYSMKANLNTCISIFSTSSTTEIFKKYYQNL